MSNTATTPGAGGQDPEALARRRAEGEAATRAFREEFGHVLGVSYGPDDRHVYDVYQPKGEPNGAAMVFVHGGGFRNGSPSTVAQNGRAILEAGGTFVCLGYRLAPETPFPASADDVAAGLAHLAAHAAEFGIDPSRIHLSGHSAGATLAGLVALGPGGPGEPQLAGLVLVSGNYAFANMSDEILDRTHPRYVPDLAGSVTRMPPLTVLIGGDGDFPTVLPANETLEAAVRAAGGETRSFVEPNADHFQAIRGFATPDDAVAKTVIQMMGLDR